MLDTIIVGHRRGVERGVLDAVEDRNFLYDGYYLKSKYNEEEYLPEKYHLKELDSDSYSYRNQMLYEKADGILILITSKFDFDYEKNFNGLKEKEKTTIILKDNPEQNKQNKDQINNWIKKNNKVKKLLIVGPHEEEMYEITL
ncbi:5764_t:CDS:1, partial [Racocetra persica]